MEGLNCSSTCYVRAYATNMAGTGYGDQVSFSTPGCEPVPGEFVFSDDDGTWLMNHEGERLLFAGTGGRNVEVYEDRIYIKSVREISVFNRDGSLYGRIDIDSRIEMALIMCVLPDGNLAFLDNENDLVSFTNPYGELIHEMSLSGVAADESLQNVRGVVVDNGLIISVDGNNRIIRIDLDTYEWSVFRDFQHLTGWLGDIDHAEGTYYLCQSRKLYSFREGEEEQLICELPEGNNAGIAVLGDFAYVVSYGGNKVYRVNVHSGDYDVIVSDANYPQDIELLP